MEGEIKGFYLNEPLISMVVGQYQTDTKVTNFSFLKTIDHASLKFTHEEGEEQSFDVIIT